MKHIPDDPAERGGYLIWQTAHLIGRGIDDALEEFRLTPAQFGAVVHIGREPGISAAELSRRINVTPQSVQTALLPLLKRGWVQRRPHPVHGRVLGNYLTPKGTAAAQQAGDAVTAFDEQLLSALSAHEQAQLKTLVARLLLTLNPTALDRSSVRVDRRG